ncbi:MAG: hypothetical protein EOO06_08785 [Chitinophagaceae bacterium]|nr:MAG: hypothetical protein EOO06_08785 [Chitinophagaceae bacterium]
MKKFLATILAVLYFATTTGVTVHMHYCMDKLVELKLWHSEKDQCSNCGMEKSQQDNGCCKDEHKQVKLENDHYKTGVAFQAMQLTALALPVYFNDIPPVIFSSVTEENPRSHAPPRSGDIAIYKRNCVFRI